jgi:hypothetical protein
MRLLIDIRSVPRYLGKGNLLALEATEMQPSPVLYPLAPAECWWGPDGIDALCFGDGIPYKFEESGR